MPPPLMGPRTPLGRGGAPGVARPPPRDFPGSGRPEGSRLPWACGSRVYISKPEGLICTKVISMGCGALVPVEDP